MSSKVYFVDKQYKKTGQVLQAQGVSKPLIVCDDSFKFLNFSQKIGFLSQKHDICFKFFTNFQPNPDYSSVAEGVKFFQDSKCDAIFAIGGGSAIDVAKCIKLYAHQDANELLLDKPFEKNDVKLFAMPTTAGTGSEATKYAVIYYNGEKQSITHENCIPEFVFFDTSTLVTLPLYQKKATMLDALCHAIESFWSVNSTKYSQKLARRAIKIIFKNYQQYLDGNQKVFAKMFKAANLAGQAINITQTTAGHAMSYKLTSMYGLSHGHAVALCLNALIPYVWENKDRCSDLRGVIYFNKMLQRLAVTMGAKTFKDVGTIFSNLLQELELEVPKMKAGDIKILAHSVNATRLKNFPISLSEGEIEKLYKVVLKKGK